MAVGCRVWGVGWTVRNCFESRIVSDEEALGAGPTAGNSATDSTATAMNAVDGKKSGKGFYDWEVSRG